MPLGPARHGVCAKINIVIMGVAFKWATSQNLKPKYLSVQCIASSEPLPLLLYLILTQMGHHKMLL